METPKPPDSGVVWSQRRSPEPSGPCLDYKDAEHAATFHT